jgi:hypothetical protein
VTAMERGRSIIKSQQAYLTGACDANKCFAGYREVGPAMAPTAQSMHGFKEAASRMKEDCRSDGHPIRWRVAAPPEGLNLHDFQLASQPARAPRAELTNQ